MAMSYKCAIFGHKYGDAEVEREREEDGKEVISTVREIETCKRCEDTRIVSENKEVTTLETAADIVADDLEPEPEPTGAADSSERPTGATPDTQTTDSPSESPSTPGESPDPPIQEAEAESAGFDTTVDPEDDDAVILDDEDEREEEQDDRAPGEWPEETTAEESGEEDTETSWPEKEMDTEEDSDGEASWELPSDIDPHPETDQGERPIPRAKESSSRAEPSSNSALTVPEGEFYCPDCGFTTPVESSSLRAGDFCPECHMATLEHQVE